MSDDVPCEGLWVYLADEEQPLIENWMARLADIKDENKKRVPLATAASQLELVASPTRGGNVELSPADQSILAELLAAPEADDPWEFEGLRRFEMFLRVERD